MPTNVSDYVALQKQLLQTEREFERDELLASVEGVKLRNLETSGVRLCFFCLCCVYFQTMSVLGLVCLTTLFR